MISFFCWRILNWFSTWLFSLFRVAIACSSSWCCSVAKYNGVFRKTQEESHLRRLHVCAILPKTIEFVFKRNVANIPSSDFLVFSSFRSLLMKRSRSSSTTVRVVWTWEKNISINICLPGVITVSFNCHLDILPEKHPSSV